MSDVEDDLASLCLEWGDHDILPIIDRTDPKKYRNIVRKRALLYLGWIFEDFLSYSLDEDIENCSDDEEFLNNYEKRSLIILREEAKPKDPEFFPNYIHNEMLNWIIDGDCSEEDKEIFMRDVYRQLLEYFLWTGFPMEKSKLPDKIKYPERIKIFEEFRDTKKRKEILDEEMERILGVSGLCKIPSEFLY